MIASIDSFLAASMNPHVLTMITSASARSAVYSAEKSDSCARYRSLSTVFLSQPSVMMPTFTWSFGSSARGGGWISPVVAEFELDAEVLAAENRDSILKIITRRRRDTHLIALNGGLHFLELGFLDRCCDFLRGIAVQGHFERDLAPHRIPSGGSYF